ncbi:hypothetical protein ACMWOD_19020, partial [Escherichia coli]|uniref:hypothetical protein n=1 Tax=Escherichia coli TaxID=562 RepID=UPI0039DF6598
PAARGMHNTLSRYRVKHFFCFSLLRFSGEPRCPGGVFAVVPCQWWRIIGSYSGLTSEKDKNFIVRSFFRQKILNIVFSV